MQVSRIQASRRHRGWIPLLLLCGLVPLLAAAPGRAATILVTTTTDEADNSCTDGDCSLRDALFTAAANDVVQVPAGNFLLTLGELVIDKDLTVRGAGARDTVVDANFESRVFSVSGAVVEISDLTVTQGSVPGGNGGGIANTGNLTLNRCTVSHSDAFLGGGIYTLNAIFVDRCTITSNHALQGGGIYLSDSVENAFIVNSTISGNTGESAGGGIAIFSFNQLVIHSTITDNSAPVGGGIYGETIEFYLTNSIVAGNTAGGDCAFVNFLFFVPDGSLDGDGTCGVELPNMDPLLGPLSDNGGPTDTHALLAGSPAIDSTGNVYCAEVGLIDQRGIVRPQGPRCDIGAFEVELVTNEPPVLASDAANVTVNEGQTAANTGTVTDADGDTVSLTASVGTVINNGNGTWSWSFTTSDGPTQSQTVTITGDDGQGGVSSTSFSLVVNNVAPAITSVTNNGPIFVGGSATITVTATDPAGANDALAYQFDCDNNGSFEVGPQAGNSTSCTFGTAGSHTVNVRVTDGDGGAATGSTVVEVVVPNQSPVCTGAAASPHTLNLPLFQVVPIQITGVTDPDLDPVTITVTSIFQDERVSELISGLLTAPDGFGVGTSTPWVRAERRLVVLSNGRVYHIRFDATDGKGGSCSGDVTVRVPLLLPAIDNGPNYNSTVP